jgi:hypothetical protein
MTIDTGPLLGTLKQAILDSPDLAVMILDRTFTIVWHNRQFGEEFKEFAAIDGMKCYDVTKNGKPHKGCPLAKTLQDGKYHRGLVDFGEQYFHFMTIPLGGGYVAKVHTYLPKYEFGMEE